MKRNSILMLAIGMMAICIGMAACNNDSSSKDKAKTEAKVADADHIYQCPMHAEITSDKLEKCSKCGMDLELVKKSEMKKAEVPAVKDSTKK
ncbi:MAG: heavy metal-binding domain-containing protein [Bacteroidota bacterium]